MAISIGDTLNHSTSGNTSLADLPDTHQKKSLIEIIKDKDTSNKLNYVFNGTASAISFLTFLNGNFHFLDSIQEKLEPFSETLSKLSFAAVHGIGAIDLWKKKNLFPFLGYASSVPVALISSGYNLILSTGITNGLINFLVVTDQREIVDKNGEPILDKNGKPQLINGDFADRGWNESFKTTLNEGFKMGKEIINKPSKIKKISHSLLVSSLTQMAGSAIGLLGLEKVGAFIRNTANIAIRTSLMLYKNNEGNTNSKGLNFKLPFVQSGILSIASAVFDLIKRSNFISDKINNLTHLSLGFDRLASIMFTKGVLNIKK